MRDDALKKVEKYYRFPLHPRKLSAGILNSQQAILSRQTVRLGSDKLARGASEAASEPELLCLTGRSDDIYK